MMLINNSIQKLTLIIITCTALAACDTDFDNPVGDSSSYSSGDADFTTFVSIGDSLTAGYADSALYLSGQENSYPAILAQQFAKTGGGSFNQPLVNDNLGGLLFGGTANPDFGNRLVLDAETSSPEPIAGDPTTEVFAPLTGSFNNMGVPGAKSYHLGVAGYGNSAGLLTSPATANPYFSRFASVPTTDATMIGDATDQLPSFFVLWIGNNDILSYATGGGEGEDQTGNTNPSTYSSNDITDPTAFGGIYAGLVAAMTGAGGKGVLINIPNVSTIPYFTTVPHNPVPLDTPSAGGLNAAYQDYNAGLDTVLSLGVVPGFDAEEVARRKISFSAGLQNAVVILDEDLTDLTGVNPALINMRQATAEDLLVLPASSKIGELVNENDDPLDPTSLRWGISAPLQDADVLTPEEQDAANTARLAYNAVIKNTADSNPDLLFLDISSLLEELQSGYPFGTGTIDSTYATGGGFSLDGVHPTARGYAVIANNIIETINTGFNANVPTVDPGEYTTIFIK